MVLHHSPQCWTDADHCCSRDNYKINSVQIRAVNSRTNCTFGETESKLSREKMHRFFVKVYPKSLQFSINRRLIRWGKWMPLLVWHDFNIRFIFDFTHHTIPARLLHRVKFWLTYGIQVSKTSKFVLQEFATSPGKLLRQQTITPLKWNCWKSRPRNSPRITYIPEKVQASKFTVQNSCMKKPVTWEKMEKDPIGNKTFYR